MEIVMGGFTENELAIAKSTDLVDVARQLGYTPYRVGHYYSVKEMDSLRIYDRKNWFRWSRQYDKGTNGGSQIDFLRVFAGMDVKEAVFWLLDFAGQRPISILHTKEQPIEKHKQFVLPEKAANNACAYNYLCKQRGISSDTVRFFICSGILYESKKYHNLVFLGKDKQGETKFASMRGIFDKDGKAFKCDVAGNDKNYGVNLISQDTEDKRVHVFEAAIDMMSYIDLIGTPDLNMIALGMLSDAPLETFLKEYPGKDSIIFHLDNDIPGRTATASLMKKYEGLGYNVFDDPVPAEFKDVNEYLQALNVPSKDRSGR